MSAVDNSPSFWARLGRSIVRLVFVIVLGASLGAGLYFGILALYRHYIQPVHENTLRLDALEARQEQSEQRTGQRLDDLAARLVALEVQSDTGKATSADLKARLIAVESAQATVVARQTDAMDTLNTLQNAMTAVQTRLVSLQGDLDALQTDQVTLRANLESLQAELDPAFQAIAENSTNIEALAKEAQAGADRWLELQRQVKLLKVMELLTRSRMYLVQGNLSLARADIQTGRDILVALQSEVPPYQVETLIEIAARLEAALESLPRSPLSAADRMEAAWQLLIEDLPGEPTSVPEVTQAPLGTAPAVTQTTPTPTFTPTPNP